MRVIFLCGASRTSWRLVLDDGIFDRNLMVSDGKVKSFGVVDSSLIVRKFNSEIVGLKMFTSGFGPVTRGLFSLKVGHMIVGCKLGLIRFDLSSV